jgi:hypothetical protein
MVMIYTRADIENFLKALDTELSRRTDLIVIGGASLSIAYNLNNMTIDIDLLNTISIELQDAIKRAKDRTHLNIPVSTTSVRAEILNMEQRLFNPSNLSDLKYLNVLVPEKYDLALMKAARNEPRNIDDIIHLHAADKLDARTLLERFRLEVLPLNSGDDDLLKQKFLEMIESLFGAGKANDYEKDL